MSSLLALALVLAQSDAPPAAPPQPWHGTLAQGLAEVRRLSEADKTDEALAVAEQLLVPNGFARWRERATGTPGWKRTIVEAAGPVLEAVGLSDLAPAERAAVHFARGVALARAAKRAESDEAFEKTRALAGPGELRLDATYDLAWTALAEGEALRAKIPELNGGAPAPAAAAPAGPDPTKSDPLDLARAAYLKARERFVEGLKANSRDEDARANAELAQKRLRELAEIQKKREEEKKKQEQQKKDDQKNDPNKKDQDKKDQDKKDQQKQDQDKKDSSSEDKDKKKPDEEPKEDKPKDDKKDQAKDEESDKDKKQKQEAQPKPAQEEQLTKEEVMRILDTLKNREEEGKKLLEQLRRARRAKVKRDW